MNILGQDAFAVPEMPGFPSLRAWLPEQDEQIMKKKLRKSYQMAGDPEQLNAQFYASDKGSQSGILSGSFESSRRNILE